MGAEFSGGGGDVVEVRRGVDPGPLSDAECDAVVAAFDGRAVDGFLDAQSVDGLLGVDGFYPQLAGARGVTVEAFLACAGTALRGSSSARLDAAARAGLGLAALVDGRGDSSRAPPRALRGVFALAATCYGVDAAAVDLAPLVAGVSRAIAEDVAAGVEDGDDARTIPAASVLRWCLRHAPTLGDAWGAYARSRLVGDAPAPAAPVLRAPSAALGGAFSSAARLQLALASPRLAGRALARLYASDVDGLSFNRLLHGILGWTGPTLLVLRLAGGESARNRSSKVS